MLTITLVSSTEKILDNTRVEWVYIPTPKGEIGILKRHSPVVWVVSPWILRIDNKEAWPDDIVSYAIWSGIYQSDWETIIVMADMVEDQEWAEDINLEKRKRKARKLMEKVQSKDTINMEKFIYAEQQMQKAVALEKLAKK